MKRAFLLLLIPFILLGSCTHDKEQAQLIIGISKGAPEEYYGNYAKWLQTADTSIVCIDLYHMSLDSALLLLENCSGLLLSGGPDVFPGRYNAVEDTALCGSIDFYRDTLEFALIEKAKGMAMPILGICRGLQIFNVYHGGNLYADIPVQLDTLISHRCPDTYDCFHEVHIVDGSSLHTTSGVVTGTVNSNHHQGIKEIGKDIRPIAHTDDGLIEAIEYEKREHLPFFMGVQWHPERMDVSNPLSLPVAMYFLQEAKLFDMERHEISNTR
jgi:putative glutamine amidotransferase